MARAASANADLPIMHYSPRQQEDHIFCHQTENRFNLSRYDGIHGSFVHNTAGRCSVVHKRKRKKIRNLPGPG